MKIATSNFDFKALREGGCVYVDKTDILYELIQREPDAHFFISRPRRFGKSLMLSTLKYIFEGRRDLFKGLKIDKKKYDWKKYPVVHFSMYNAAADAPEKIDAALTRMVRSYIIRYKLKTEFKHYDSSGEWFNAMMTALAAKYGSFVVLIDEYDVPLQGFLGDAKAIRKVRKTMHDFYVQLKDHVEDIRFQMITGVTKLTKLSLFSGLNNPTDLTMDSPECAGLLGYTPEEIRRFFGPRISQLAKKAKLTEKEYFKKILDWYDSYRFCPDSKVKVCNPISIGKLLQDGLFLNYWAKTASASMLVERLQKTELDNYEFTDVESTRDDLDVCDALKLPLVPLMYQSGYLTIKDVKEDGDLILGVPNKEVRTVLNSLFWKSLLQIEEKSFKSLVDIAKEQLSTGDIDGLFNSTLYRLYAKLPSTWTPKKEADAKRYFLLFMEMIGGKCDPEKASSRGQADMIVETKKQVLVIEFKYNRSAKAAIRQIREKGYADAYKGDKRPVTLVGLNFRSSKRNIDEPVTRRSVMKKRRKRAGIQYG